MNQEAKIKKIMSILREVVVNNVEVIDGWRHIWVQLQISGLPFNPDDFKELKVPVIKFGVKITYPKGSGDG